MIALCCQRCQAEGVESVYGPGESCRRCLGKDAKRLRDRINRLQESLSSEVGADFATINDVQTVLALQVSLLDLWARGAGFIFDETETP